MKCHLAYSVPNTGMITQRILRKIRAVLQQAGLPISVIGKRGNVNTNSWPTQAPYTITKHLYKELVRRVPTLLYHPSERVRCPFEPNDIFIGHPFFPYSDRTVGVTELSINREPRPRVFALLSPLHCNTRVKTNHLSKNYLDAVGRLLPGVDILFAIMGQYWWDQWTSSPYSHWKPKMVRLDMAVNIQNYPRVKKAFNPPGKRGYLYIGNNDPVKGIELLSKLLSGLGEYPRGWIGSGAEIPGIPRINRHTTLTSVFMSQLAERFDFFITTGVADANPTTILESMAWGFPVICTPQSGYYATPYRKNVFFEDIPASLEILRELQFAHEADLMRMADEARYVVEAEYNWDNFVRTIVDNLNRVADCHL